MQRYSILLADDDIEDRFIITDAFKETGCENSVFFVENGEEVMSYLQQLHNPALLPGLIVLDLNMPKMNGTETLRLLKAHEVYANIKVIIFSTSVNERERKECMELGAVAYITKPAKYSESLATAKLFCEYSNDL